MNIKYKTFSNPLFITNSKMVVEVFTEKEKQGKEENQAPYKRLSKSCINCGAGNLTKTYDGYWCKWCKTEL